METLLDRAADAIASADAMLVAAGAGMGVDSGLPDFRGTQGFWRAYPPYARLGLSFSAMANPRWFGSDPEFAWGFYGHRLNLYRETVPHDGFRLIREWTGRMTAGSFVYTSNVDGQFQRAGFDPERVVEAHGAIDFLQCLSDCGAGVVPADGHVVTIDESTMRARRPLPGCPSCGGLARPNILMFGDGGWDSSRSDLQTQRLARWLRSLDGQRLVILEIGAGSAIPTVRIQCEDQAERPDAMLIRINPREPEVPEGHVGIPMGALDALEAISERLAF